MLRMCYIHVNLVVWCCHVGAHAGLHSESSLLEVFVLHSRDLGSWVLSCSRHMALLMLSLSLLDVIVLLSRDLGSWVLLCSCTFMYFNA